MKTILKNIQIKAVASWLPEQTLEMSSLNDRFGEDIVAQIVKTTGIKSVRVTHEKDTSADMCFRAVQHLMEKEGTDRTEIDGLVFVSQTPDYILPSTSICLQKRALSGRTISTA